MNDTLGDLSDLPPALLRELRLGRGEVPQSFAGVWRACVGKQKAHLVANARAAHPSTVALCGQTVTPISASNPRKCVTCLRRENARLRASEHATNCSGPAHGEHPVVNGKAGVLSAQGSTPPSSTNSSQQTSTSQQGEKP